MGEVTSDRYWCHMCAQVVNPVVEFEIKCPFCDSGFIEEMNSANGEEELEGTTIDEDDEAALSDHSLSLLAPILLGLMGGRPRRRRSRFLRVDDESDSDEDHDLDALFRRRRRSSAILQLLQSFHDFSRLDNETPEREEESLLLINPYNEALLLQGAIDSDNADRRESNNRSVGASLGDYLIGPGLDMLLQYLAENDPNRYGTPPAKKEAIDALPTVKVDEGLNCSVCLDDFEIGTEATEMPCKHKFHSGCIMPWLELHSSCPVCRFEIPADESKVSQGSRAEGSDGVATDRGNGSRPSLPAWSLSALFSSSGSRRRRNSSSNPSSSTTSDSNYHEDEN